MDKLYVCEFSSGQSVQDRDLDVVRLERDNNEPGAPIYSYNATFDDMGEIESFEQDSKTLVE